MGKKEEVKRHQLNQQLKEAHRKNKELGDENEQLKSKLKAKEAEAVTAGQALSECQAQIQEFEQKAVTIIQPEDNPGLMTYKKILEMSAEAQMNKHLTEEERAKSALSFQREYQENELDFMRKENEIRRNRPEVIEAANHNEQRRFVHRVTLWLGVIVLLLGLSLIVGFIVFGVGLSAMVVGMTIGTLGIMFCLYSISPYFSSEDTDKVERLAKLFRVFDRFKSDLPQDDNEGQN